MQPPPITRTWHAHHEAVTHMFVIRKRAVVTCSAEQSVAVWRIDGELMGMLDPQGKAKYDTRVVETAAVPDTPGRRSDMAIIANIMRKKKQLLEWHGKPLYIKIGDGVVRHVVEIMFEMVAQVLPCVWRRLSESGTSKQDRPPHTFNSLMTPASLEVLLGFAPS